MTEVTTVSTAVPAPSTAAPPATAPAPTGVPQYEGSRPGGQVADATKWGPLQAQAHAELQALRAEVLNPEGKAGVNVAKVKFREISEFLYAGGPVPTHLRPASEAPDPTSPDTDSNGFRRADFASVYEPATQPSDYALRHGAKLPDGVAADPQAASDMLGGLQEFAFAMKLPPEIGSDVIGRILHHSANARDDEAGGRTTFVAKNSDFARELYTEADRLLQPVGGLQKALDGVEKYMRAVLSQDQYAEIQALLTKPDGRISTAAIDPVLIYKILSVARARGIVAE